MSTVAAQHADRVHLADTTPQRSRVCRPSRGHSPLTDAALLASDPLTLPGVAHTIRDTFAAGLLRDVPGVTAGLTLSWNSGAVEGHVNRIKMLKRQMFGRAGFRLLRKRVLLA